MNSFNDESYPYFYIFVFLCVVINVLKSVKSDGAAFLME